ncbi:hypothetical protein BV22DRAFT_997795, partial [Leucogyrophana mollusca]
LQWAGLSTKCVQKLAAERNPILRAGFAHHIGQYPAHFMIHIDEVSKNNRTYAHLWGRGIVGERVEKHDPFVQKQQLSMLGAIALDKSIVAVRVIEGLYTAKTFLEFLRDDLLPLTNPYPAPCSVIVLDNAH